MNLPGVCIVCRQPVVWRGRSWKEPQPPGSRRVYSRHVCPSDRPLCNLPMKRLDERCARRPGHTTEHRSRYALDNARAMRTGLGL